MSELDLVIRGAQLVLPSGVAALDIGVADGVIVALEPELSGAGAVERDARGLHAFPGAIDPHVHFQEPGRAEFEGFASGTAALAAGGGTVALDMPINALPPTTTAAALRAKLAAASARAHVDFGLWGGIVPGNLDELDELWSLGAVAFKAFMCASGDEEFPRSDDATLHEAMCRAAQLGAVVGVHAENEELTAALARRALAEGRHGVDAFLASRPVLAEVEAIRRACTLAQDSGAALHIVHVSSGAGVAAVIEARARGVDVTCETCPHYLVLCDEDLERLGALAKCAPPLRPVHEGQTLWRFLERGEGIDLIASDHAPCPPEHKRTAAFTAAWSGIAGVQSTTRVVLDGALERGIALHRVADLLAGAAARRFGLAGKGSLALGNDADIALVDLGARTALSAAELHTRHRHDPYVGRVLRGRVVETLVRGATVVRDGRLLGEPGHGRAVRSARRALLAR